LFRYCIVRFDLKTPGREADEPVVEAKAATDGDEADRFIAALGGAANLREVDACTTRLRLTLADRERIDAAALRRLGSRGTVNLGTHGLQVVVGPMADQIAGDIRARLSATSRPVQSASATQIIAALGGAGNVARIETASGRVLVTVKDPARIDEPALRAACTRGIAIPKPASVHLLHADPAGLESELALLIG
jgi:PTS system N-acetylglucosamine-specific IIC component